MDGTGIPHEQVRVAQLEPADLRGVLPVAHRVRRVGQVETLVPPLVPRLLLPRELGELGVLLPEQVPEQPAHGVRLVVRPPPKLLGRQPVEHGTHPLLHAGEAVGEQVLEGVHRQHGSPAP
ncbi:hypothetical protein BJF80_04060 [Serinicoccus sp. CUA-874]|nr:hypothetical protein BJF80_04060 [Serinicoccus sp. CUA-874]